ncbi:copper amine oxidase N-terminal domain-containing protein [Paenibacillus tarimensis]|uniref:copper amine oxidase N-terminal domain-containing protein n=1 Tax=Paenibacillus tarimensis TaxID=416012 RepID=UPI001F2F1058|nr:copper amine oxidase N-terminal domain-containing protein [Paenibacillus tarimensis]MCF2943768.1 copper amine oxidase N-terminal domain-containing protein [Paenibacillus tarimensis]
MNSMKSKLAVLLLSLTMVFVAGCQAVAGVDLNKVLKQSLITTSYEGSQTLEFELLINKEQLEELQEAGGPGSEALAMLSHVKLEMSDIKVSDANHASMKGKLSLGDVSIGFGLKLAGETLEIQLEGAKRPILLDLSEEALNGILMPGAPGASAPEVDKAAEDQLTEIGKRVIDLVGGYAIDNMPNPESLSVKPVVATVGGEELNLMQVQVELNGKQIWQWIITYLDALIQDEEGLTQVMIAVNDLMKDNKDLFASLGAPFPEESLPVGASDEKQLKELAAQLTSLLKDLKANMEQAAAESPESIETVFNDQTYLKTNVYVDSKLDIRKTETELMIKPKFPAAPAETEEEVLDDEAAYEEMLDEEMYEEDMYEEGFYGGLGGAASAMSFIEGIRISSSSEQWNVNGEVAAEKPAAGADALGMEELSGMQGYQFLREFNSNSVMYDLLKNTFGVGHQQVVLDPEYSQHPPIVTPDGRTLVPLRTTAEAFGAEVKYNGKTKSATILDEATGTEIVLKKGSKTAVINGKSVQWSFPVTSVKGTLYVPARDLTKALKGTLYWETLYDEEKILVIERDIA